MVTLFFLPLSLPAHAAAIFLSLQLDYLLSILGTNRLARFTESYVQIQYSVSNKNFFNLSSSFLLRLFLYLGITTLLIKYYYKLYDSTVSLLLQGW